MCKHFPTDVSVSQGPWLQAVDGLLAVLCKKEIFGRLSRVTESLRSWRVSQPGAREGWLAGSIAEARM